MDTHIDADGAPDVNDAENGDAGGEVISSRSRSSNADTNTTSSHPNTQTNPYATNTQTKGRKPMLIPIPTDKGVELLQLPDYIPPRKDVWRELRAGDDEEERGGKRDGGDGDGGERGEGGDDVSQCRAVVQCLTTLVSLLPPPSLLRLNDSY
ncbi:hypothetical protein PLEOSDRAFT_159901 [Pleurotus ostreatus PC15]|uniref:Uncharacterized protein n=1 Tax=Pleurotus ostreatus (strain PC15) TaxID=1137138 RepID=A0A067NNR5_PLEO1|nr:hypothetical protein PLEOSDRAFT_159901 [Pleurotus ostreatus PC15]